MAGALGSPSGVELAPLAEASRTMRHTAETNDSCSEGWRTQDTATKFTRHWVFMRRLLTPEHVECKS